MTTLDFGKYKNKSIDDIFKIDPFYLKYLCCYVFYYDYDDKQINISNIVYTKLEEIIGNKESYIQQCTFLKKLQKLNISSIKWWDFLETLSKRKQIKLIYENKEEFDLFQSSFSYKPINFSNFWLWINKYEYIKNIKQYVKDNDICIYCFKKMPPIGTSRKNGYNHHDWDNRLFHKNCYFKIKQQS